MTNHPYPSRINSPPCSSSSSLQQPKTSHLSSTTQHHNIHLQQQHLKHQHLQHQHHQAATSSSCNILSSHILSGNILKLPDHQAATSSAAGLSATISHKVRHLQNLISRFEDQNVSSHTKHTLLTILSGLRDCKISHLLSIPFLCQLFPYHCGPAVGLIAAEVCSNLLLAC